MVGFSKREKAKTVSATEDDRALDRWGDETGRRGFANTAHRSLIKQNEYKSLR